MICTYRVQYSSDTYSIFKCDASQLKKKIAEKSNKIPYDQIVLIDKDNKLFNPSINLTQTQMINPNLEQIYTLVDLQKIIMEWSKMKIDNNIYQKTIEAIQNELNELRNQIERYDQEKKKNLSDREISNNTIDQLREDLEKKTQQYSLERQQLSENIKNLQFQISENVTQLESQQKQLQNLEQDLNEKQKSAENLQMHQTAQIQQLNTQISEKDNLIKNLTSQIQSQQYQLQQWQNGFNNYQQQVTTQNQKYEQLINEITEEKDSLDRKLKTEKTKNQTSTQQISGLETELNNSKMSITKLEGNIKKLQQQVDNYKQEQDNLEQERYKVTKEGQNVQSEASKLKQELLKQKNDYAQLQFEKEQIQNDFNNFKQQYTVFAQQAEKTLKSINQEHEEALLPLNNKINQLNTDLNNLKKQLFDANSTIKEKEDKINHTQQENKQLQLQLDQLNSSGNSLGLQKQNLEQTTKQLQNELDEAKRLYQAEKNKYRTAENDKTQLKGELQSKDIELTSEKNNHDATRRERDSYKDQCNKMRDQFKNLQDQTTVEAQRLTTQVQVAEKKIDRVIQNFGELKTFEKITGPLEKIMASEFKINRFTEDPNSQSDDAKYNLIEITLQFDKYTKYVKEGGFFLIDECFQYGNKINIKAIRSIQANAESEFYKGYLIRIIESTQPDLKTKTLLRKDLKLQNQAFQNKEDAARLAVNNIFCQWIQMQFNKELTTAKLQPQKQIIQRQFIIENEDKKEFYYCEMVEEGPYSKINGGKFIPQKDDIHQYFNALSLYSYKMLEQQMILTNFQVCGNYVYDMIVHTNHKGLFSPLDQGSHESITFTEILGKQPADIMSKSWNETVKNLAEKYLRG